MQRPVNGMLSPGLASSPELGQAFELKFHLSPTTAEFIESWARQHLLPDMHGNDGAYSITSVYCDTPAFDVFHRNPGFRRNKFRLRRYGDSTSIFLERKRKKGECVLKTRVEIPDEQLPVLDIESPPPDWTGAWFIQRLRKRGLRPTVRVAYRRTAFMAMVGTSPVRLTLDRDVVGVATRDWDVLPVPNGQPLLPGNVLLELKFHVHMPVLFQELLPHLPSRPGRSSKYRLCVESCGLVKTGEPPCRETA